MNIHRLVFIGEPECGKTVFFVRMRDFMAMLVSHQRSKQSPWSGLASPPALRLREWLRGRFADMFELVGLGGAVAHYVETQETTERMRSFQQALVAGQWPKSTDPKDDPSTRRADITIVRGVSVFRQTYTVSLRDYCGETVMRACGAHSAALSPPDATKGSKSGQVLDRSSPLDEQSEELRCLIDEGCSVVFVLDGKKLYEGKLPEISERAIAALAKGALDRRRSVRLICVVTKRDEIDDAERGDKSPRAAQGEAWAASSYLSSEHPAFWNHLMALGAPCIEVSAVKTRVGAVGKRVPVVTTGEFDVGLARVVEWFLMGSTR